MFRLFEIVTGRLLAVCCVHLLAAIEVKLIDPYGGLRVTKHIVTVVALLYRMTLAKMLQCFDHDCPPV